MASIYDRKPPAAKSSRGRSSFYERTSDVPRIESNEVPVAASIDGSEIDSTHGTLVASTHKSVYVVGSTSFRVQNRSTTDTITYKFSVEGTAATPTALVSDSIVLPPGATDEWDLTEESTVNVSMVSAGTPGYSVEAW